MTDLVAVVVQSIQSLEDSGVYPTLLPHSGCCTCQFFLFRQGDLNPFLSLLCASFASRPTPRYRVENCSID